MSNMIEIKWTKVYIRMNKKLCQCYALMDVVKSRDLIEKLPTYLTESMHKRISLCYLCIA